MNKWSQHGRADSGNPTDAAEQTDPDGDPTTTDRVDGLETELAQKDEHINDLETAVTEQDAILSAVRKKTDNTRTMVRELQERDLEKNAHLRWENVYPRKEELEISADHFEKFTKDDDTAYARILGGEGPLNRGGKPTLTTSDLLPIQQLARMDDNILHSVASSKPVRLATEVWQDHEQEQSTLWNQGCNGVREYIDAGELA